MTKMGAKANLTAVRPSQEMSLQQAQEAVGGQIPEWYDENEAFAAKRDHFQEGRGYIGPDGGPNHPARSVIIKAAGDRMVFRDALNEVLDRVRDGLMKQEPRLGAVPLRDVEEGEEYKPEEEKAIVEIRTLVGQWWDNNEFHRKMRNTVRRSRWAERTYLHIWVPQGLLESPSEEDAEVPLGAGRFPPAPFPVCLRKIHLEPVSARSATILTDPETQRKFGIYLFRMDDKEYAELSWVNYDADGTPGTTTVRILGGEEPVDVEMDLGGRLPLIEMRADLLITEAVRRQQKSLNFLETAMDRNVETGGWPERVITNAEPAGIWVERNGPPGPYRSMVQEGKVWELHPVPRVLGAGVTSEIVGIPLKDKDGNTQMTSPGVYWKDPTDPALTISAAQHRYATLLHEAKQLHVLIAGDATASGVSRQQARSDHETDLHNTKGATEACAITALETVVAMADHFSSDKPRYMENYRITLNLFVSAGPVSPDEERATHESYDKRLISRDEAMTRVGVEDTEEMRTAIDNEPSQQLSLAKQRAEAMAALVNAGWNRKAAALYVGFEEENLKRAFELDWEGAEQ